jgi:hypothetical protein
VDIGQEIFLGLFAGVVALVLTVMLHKNFAALFSSISFAIVLVPLLFIFLSGVLEMQSVSSNVTALNEIGSKTTTRLWTYLGDNIQGIVVSDLVGLVLGTVSGFVYSIRSSI